MNTQRDLAPRLRLAGLLASVIAVAAMALTILADNQNVGFGQIVTRREQMFLFVIALLLPRRSPIWSIEQDDRRRMELTRLRPPKVMRKTEIGKFMSSEIMRQILQAIEEEMSLRLPKWNRKSQSV